MMSNRFFRNSLIIIGIIFIIIFGFIDIVTSDCPLCDDCQTWQNNYGNLTVCPKICYNAIHQKQYWYLFSYVTQEIDIVFRFNFSLTRGGLYFWNGNNYIKVNIEHLEYNDYHYYFYTGFNVNEGQNYSGYWYYDVPMGSVGKWDMYIKLSSDPIGTWRIHLDPYWDSDYNSRYNLYVNSSQVDNDLANFPVRVYINGNTNIGNVCQNDLDDLVFVDTTNTTVFNYELENYSFDGNKLYANYFVNITSVSSGSDTHFNLYYNNSGAVSQENSTGVWDSDYLAVFHMGDSDDQITDSTDYDNDFTESSSPNYQQYGISGYSVRFDGTDDYFENNVLDLTEEENLSFECFYKPDYVTGNSNYFIFSSKYDNNDNIRFVYHADLNDCGNIWIFDDGVIDGGDVYGHTMSTDNWYHYAVSSTNSGSGFVYGFFNGVKELSDNSVDFDYNGLDNNHRIGCRYLENPSVYFDGFIDEIRLSKTARSDSWIISTYNTVYNYTGVDSFIIWGDSTDLYHKPNIVVSNVFPKNNSYWCSNIINLTNISVKVENPYGTSFKVEITFFDNYFVWDNVYNDTYNVSLTDINNFPLGTTNYTWILNVSAYYCVPAGGDCFYNGSFNFDVCWESLIYMQVVNLEEGTDDIWSYIGGAFSLDETTIGVILLIFLMFLAEKREDAIYYLLVSILALPLGVYLLYSQTVMFDIFLGLVAILISVYYVYLFLYYSLRFAGGKNKR